MFISHVMFNRKIRVYFYRPTVYRYRLYWRNKLNDYFITQSINLRCCPCHQSSRRLQLLKTLLNMSLRVLQCHKKWLLYYVVARTTRISICRTVLGCTGKLISTTYLILLYIKFFDFLSFFWVSTGSNIII